MKQNIDRLTIVNSKARFISSTMVPVDLKQYIWTKILILHVLTIKLKSGFSPLLTQNNRFYQYISCHLSIIPTTTLLITNFAFIANKFFRMFFTFWPKNKHTQNNFAAQYILDTMRNRLKQMDAYFPIHLTIRWVMEFGFCCSKIAGNDYVGIGCGSTLFGCSFFGCILSIWTDWRNLPELHHRTSNWRLLI